MSRYSTAGGGRDRDIGAIDAPVAGWVEPEFEAVLDEFAANFDERGEVGGAVCVYVDGRPVVDLWGGTADPATARPWAQDSIVNVFSSTKGITAICVNLLIERGRLDPDAPVASYWPEFAQGGKAGVTVRQVLSHQAGLPYVERDLALAEVLAWDAVVEALAAQEPHWEPGTRHGYHMRTYGWLAGELVRRVDGRTIGQFVRDELAGPLDLSLWIGLPAEVDPRVAPIVPPDTDLGALLAPLGDTLLLARVFSNPGGHFDYSQMWNTRELRAAELPSSNGHADARSLARLYAACIGTVDGVRVLQPATVERATRVEASGPDEVLLIESTFGLGFMLGTSFGATNPPDAFGHAGAGGSLAFASPKHGLAFGYVMNDLRFDPKGDPRSERLVEAALRARG